MTSLECGLMGLLACTAWAGADGVAAVVERAGQPIIVDLAMDPPHSRVLVLKIDDVQGTYSIPYVQSDRDVSVSVRAGSLPADHGAATLILDGNEIARHTARAPEFTFAWKDLAPGEYTIAFEAFDASGGRIARTRLEGIGVGVVLAAIGDSITEGYYGRGFHVETLDLSVKTFPSDAVSRDGRNFPQFAPTTKDHLPSVNCFESWMTMLNDRLSTDWKQPVFIANEGWGGITSENYLNMMRTDAGWRRRMQALRPRVWLIHLGVNDERARVAAEAFERNLREIVGALTSRYGARPEHVLLAKPCYDYFDGAPEHLEAYCAVIEKLTREMGLSPGPDFFAAYATDRARWYGEDPVHPNVEGMKRMAAGWGDALLEAFPEAPR